MFVKNSDNVALLLKILEEYDFHVRRPCVRLITLLLEHRGKELQEVILVAPMGVSKLMDLLSDSREVIRNDVSTYIHIYTYFYRDNVLVKFYYLMM